MDQRLKGLAALQQRDKVTAYSNLLQESLSTQAPSLIHDLGLIVSNVVNDEQVGLVVARQVLNDLVKSVEDGAIKDMEAQKSLIRKTLEVLQPRLVSFEEQVRSMCKFSTFFLSHVTRVQASALRYKLADILEREEEWAEAARVLMGISMESGNRCVIAMSIYVSAITSRSRTWSEQDRFRLYIRIVRLSLEEEDSVQAETYYNRAALLAPHNTDREQGLMFKLSQARIHDYTRRFLEAAVRYHELSWETDIDEEERLHML